MSKKILFSDLIELNTTLNIDNKYIFYKKECIYFLNVDFNCFSFSKDSVQIVKNNMSMMMNMPIKLSVDNLIIKEMAIRFYHCNFQEELPPFYATIKMLYRCKFEYPYKIDNSILHKKCYIHTISEECNIEGGEIENLKLVDKSCNKKYYINRQYGGNFRQTKITNLIIKNTIFFENFKLHNCEIKNIEIENTDFNKHADFFKSIFHQGVTKNKNIYFKGINFKGLAIFGDTVFKRVVIFKYVTFESFSHFRETNFNKGLNLDYCNIQQEINFFNSKGIDTKESILNTSQETYRIIKHNFEKIGNKIEANKYFALELEKRKNNLKKERPRKWTDYIVFQVHWYSSSFGTSWFRTLIWILMVGLISTGITNYYEWIHYNIFFKHVYLLITESLPWYDCFLNIYLFITSQSSWSNFFANIYLLSKNEVLQLSPFMFIFNKILLGYLYYQFVISIKKDVRK
jgi:hypothetical protein